MLRCGRQPHPSLLVLTPRVTHPLPWAVGWARPLASNQQDRTCQLPKARRRLQPGVLALLSSTWPRGTPAPGETLGTGPGGRSRSERGGPAPACTASLGRDRLARARLQPHERCRPGPSGWIPGRTNQTEIRHTCYFKPLHAATDKESTDKESLWLLCRSEEKPPPSWPVGEPSHTRPAGQC